MRQAGRYLPEYRKIREKYSMLQMVMTPELACEVTLQPIERFPLDAAIIFADILTPLIGMDVSLEFKKGEGPVISNPIRSAADVERLQVPEPRENVAYTLDAIKLVVRQLGDLTPLIGFSGAPFTLSCYLIEGQSPGDLSSTKKMMFSDPETWHALQEKLVPLVRDYLVAQAEAGCKILQIFDSWLGYLGPREYDEFVEPYLTRIVEEVRARVNVPLIFFSTGTAGLYPRIGKLDVQALGVDWRTSLTDAAKLYAKPVPLQGNLDPQLLKAAPWEVVEQAATAVLDEGRGLPGHIFNLGHGILPETPVENVERLVQLVRSYKG
jgi:uroporphyrinogen decarboxylase